MGSLQYCCLTGRCSSKAVSLSVNDLDAAELYDPASGIWSEAVPLSEPRGSPTATLLFNGQVLVAGGENDNGLLLSTELYDTGLGFDSSWQPRITTATMTNQHKLSLIGTLFQGISQASGGNYQDSSTNYPIVQLRRLDNSQVTFLLVDPLRGWSDTVSSRARQVLSPVGAGDRLY